MWDKNKEIIKAIKKLMDYSFSGLYDRDYRNLCTIAKVDYDTVDDVIDEEQLKDRIKRYADDGDFFMVKNLLKDIDLTAELWLVNSNGRPVDIDVVYCEELRDELIEQLKGRLDAEWLDKLYKIEDWDELDLDD